LAEKHIRDANEELADKVKALEIAKKQVSVKEGVLTHKKGELEKIIADTEKEETALNKVSVDARSHIDERLIYSYDRIRKSYRNGLAVVPVERDACGGCFNSIPPQRQSEIRLHKKIIVCENCGRILVDSDLNDTVEAK
jgi:predicted  nucleic acid-binding Zn-ribbon protein